MAFHTSDLECFPTKHKPPPAPVFAAWFPTSKEPSAELPGCEVWTSTIASVKAIDPAKGRSVCMIYEPWSGETLGWRHEGQDHQVGSADRVPGSPYLKCLNCVGGRMVKQGTNPWTKVDHPIPWVIVKRNHEPIIQNNKSGLTFTIMNWTWFWDHFLDWSARPVENVCWGQSLGALASNTSASNLSSCGDPSSVPSRQFNYVILNPNPKGIWRLYFAQRETTNFD